MKPSLIVPLMLMMGGFFLTPNQRGWFHYQRGNWEEAASLFEDPFWRGSAQYRQGDFKAAAASFSALNSAESLYNLGNAQVMQGLYEAALSSYDQALQQRPEWVEAQENRELARSRAEALKTEGGDMTGGMLAADEVVFDDQAKSSPDAGDEEVMTDQELSVQEQQAMWMRKINTSPSTFLKNKFQMQLKEDESGQ